MATKWADHWTFDTWDTIETQNVLLWPIFEMCKGASDERLSFVENIHEDEFDDTTTNARRTFPDLNDTILQWKLNYVSTHSLEDVLERSLLQTGLWIINDSFTTGTISESNDDCPEAVILADLLTDVFGYASGVPLHRETTGLKVGRHIPLSSWAKQWFEVLNYQKYWQIEAWNLGDMEYCYVYLGANYQVVTENEGASSGYYSNAQIELTTQNGNIYTDVYTNDGVDPYPPPVGSNYTDFFADCEDLFNTERDALLADDANWTAITTNESVRNNKQTTNYWVKFYEAGIGDWVKINNLTYVKSAYYVRFKNDARKRPTSGQTFQSKVFHNYYVFSEISEETVINGGSGGVTYSDGTDHNQAFFNEIEEDTDTWLYYHNDADWTPLEPEIVDEVTEAYFDSQFVGVDLSIENIKSHLIDMRWLTNGANWNVPRNKVFLMPNDPAGTAFEYFTPT